MRPVAWIPLLLLPMAVLALFLGGDPEGEDGRGVVPVEGPWPHADDLTATGRGGPGLEGASTPRARHVVRRPDQAPPPPDAYSIHGHVRDAETGAPVGGVPVFAFPRPWGIQRFEITERTVSAADGSYHFGRLRASRSTRCVVAMGRGWISREIADPLHVRREMLPEAEAVAGVTFDLDLRVVAAARVEGRVLRPDGSPAAGAVVRGLRREVAPGVAMMRHFTPEDLLLPIHADENGHFAFPAVSAQGGLVLEARAEGLPWARSEPASVPAAETTSLTIRLRAGRDLRVQVLSAGDDRPIAGAGVFATCIRKEDGFVDPRDVEAETDAAGRTGLLVLPADPVFLQVRAFGHEVYSSPAGLDALTRTCTPVPGRPGAYRATIRLARLGVAAGTLRAPPATPAGWTSLVVFTAVPEGGGDAFGFRGVQRRVEASGDFELALPRKGRFRLEVTAACDPRPLTGSAWVQPGDRGVQLALAYAAPDPADALPADVRWWSVTLVGPGGQPVRHSRASLVVPEEDGEPLYGDEVGDAKGFEGGAAHYRFPVRPRTRGVWVQVTSARLSDGRTAAPRVVGPFDGRGGERIVHLEPSRVIRGRVLGVDGCPLQGQLVVAEQVDPGGPREDEYLFIGFDARALSDARGCFVLRGLADGLHALWLRPQRGLVAQAPVKIRAGAEDVVLRTKPPVRAVVTVEDADGRPVAGATVRLRLDDEGPWQRRELGDVEARVGAAGRCQLDGLDGTARYGLSVDPPGDRDDLRRATRRNWSPAETRIVLASRAAPGEDR